MKYSITDAAHYVVKHPLFDIVSLIVIVANSVTLSLEGPGTQSNPVLEYIDHVFLALYTAEMLFKICGFGFVLNRGSYLRDPWNILDFTIVVSSYILLAISADSNFNTLRSFRVL